MLTSVLYLVTGNVKRKQNMLWCRSSMEKGRIKGIDFCLCHLLLADVEETFYLTSHGNVFLGWFYLVENQCGLAAQLWKTLSIENALFLALLVLWFSNIYKQVCTIHAFLNLNEVCCFSHTLFPISSQRNVSQRESCTSLELYEFYCHLCI